MTTTAESAAATSLPRQGGAGTRSSREVIACVDPSSPSPDAIKDALKACTRLPVVESLSIAADLVGLARQHGMVSRGVHLLHARVHARAGDPARTASALLEAASVETTDIGQRVVPELRLLLASTGTEALRAAVADLAVGGLVVPLPLPPDARTLREDHPLLGATTDNALAEAFALSDGGGPDDCLPVDVATLGRLLGRLRSLAVDRERWTTTTVELAGRRGLLTPRLLGMAAQALADLGQVEPLEALYVLAAQHAVVVPAELDVQHVLAHANSGAHTAASEGYRRLVERDIALSARVRRQLYSAFSASGDVASLLHVVEAWVDEVASEASSTPPSPAVLMGFAVEVGNTLGLSPVLETLERLSAHVPLAPNLRVRLIDLAVRCGDPVQMQETALFLRRRGATCPDRLLTALLRAVGSPEPGDHVAARRPLAEAGALDEAQLTRHVEDLVATGGLGEALRATDGLSGPAAEEQYRALCRAAVTARDADVAAAAWRRLVEGAVRDDGALPPDTVRVYLGSVAYTDGLPAAEKLVKALPAGLRSDDVWSALAGAHARKGGLGRVKQILGQYAPASPRRRRQVRVPVGILTAYVRATPKAERFQAHKDLLARSLTVDLDGHYWVQVLAGVLVPERLDTQDPQEQVAAADRAVAHAEELLPFLLIACRHGWPQDREWEYLLSCYPTRRPAYGQSDSLFVAASAALAPDDGPALAAAFVTSAAGCHARAGLPDRVQHLRNVAVRAGLPVGPALLGEHLRALGASGRADEAIAMLLAHLSGGADLGGELVEPLAAALTAPGNVDRTVEVLQLLLAAGHLDDDVLHDIVGCCMDAYVRLRARDPASALVAWAQQRGLVLVPSVLAAVASLNRPPTSEDVQESWTSGDLAAYNDLLAHDLRQPLSVLRGVSGSLSTILGGLTSGERWTKERVISVLRDTTGLVDGAAERMDVVTSRLQASALLERKTTGKVPVGDVVDAVRAEFGREMARLGVELVLTVPRGVPKVRGHALLVESAVSNLVRNALKEYELMGRDGLAVPERIDVVATFTPAAAEELGVARQGWVMVEVRDQGRGVSAEVAENLMSPKLSAAPGHGAGIGLSAIERMIRLNGGRLWVDTSSQHGSTFCFRLPAAA